MRRLLRLLRLPHALRSVPARSAPARSARTAPPGPSHISGQHHRRPPNAGGYYRSAACPPLSANQIRARRFPGARRGLDPGEVTAFLSQVTDEVAALRTELAMTLDENLRLKDALRDWQSRFGPGVRA